MSTTEAQQANEWFLSGREKAIQEWQKMPVDTKANLLKGKEAMERIVENDKKFEAILNTENPNLTTREAPGYVMKNTTPQRVSNPENKPVYYVNQTVAADIAAYRSKNAEFSQKTQSMSTGEMQDEYLLGVMKRQGYEPGLNVQKDLENFKQDNPNLVRRAESMPREYLENTLVLNAMKKDGYSPEVEKMKSFLNRPENAEMKKEVENLVQHIRNPDVRERVAMTRKAPQVLKAHGIKI